MVRPPGPPPARRLERFAIPLIFLAGLAAYHNSFRGAFVMDDSTAVVRNTTIRTPLTPSVLSPPRRTAVSGRPLVNLSLALNYAIGGLDVTSYHVVNLIVHVLAALVLFGVVRRTLSSPGLEDRYRERASELATAIALLWVVHPLASESVDYTIQRTELMMGLFLMLTLYCSFRSFEAPRRPRRRRIWQAGALAAFALGMASKEVAAVAPLLVLVGDALFWSGSFRDAVLRRWRLYAGFAAILVVCIFVVSTRFHLTLAGFVRYGVTPWQYALTQAGVIVHYLRLALWPAPLVADYDGWPIATSVGSVLPALLLVSFIVLLTAWGLLRRKKLAFLGAVFLLVLAPTSSFRPQAAEVAAERRMYVPLAAVLALVVLGADAVGRRRRTPKAVEAATVAALALVLGILTVRRNEDYRTTLSFWTDVVEKRPDNARARVWLGNYLDDHGRSAEAFAHMATAVRLQPRNATAHYDLATMLASRGRTDDAIAHYRQSLRIQPGKAEVHNNLGISLVHAGRIDEAIEHYGKALRIDPGHAFAHYNLAQALVLQGRTKEAAVHLEAVVRLKPGFGSARRELSALQGVGDRSRPASATRR